MSPVPAVRERLPCAGARMPWGARARWLTGLALAGLLPGLCAGAAGAQPAAGPMGISPGDRATSGSAQLLVQVRDTPPSAAASFHRGRDRSYTVSTGGGADRDDSGPGAAGGGAVDNGATWGTRTSVRQVQVREKEPVRVDLPSVQSLQFHTPGKAPAPGAAPGSAPGVSGVVYFEAVTAFVARFALAGSRVRIELVPLHTGEVEAPLLDGGSRRSGSIVLQGQLGEWIALGDTELPMSGKGLNVTAEPPAPASIWVRVYRADRPEERKPAE